jgi:hypothetical protein
MRAFTPAFTRACAAAALVVALSVPAFAQDEGSSRPTRRTDAQKQEDATVDKAYRAATKGDRNLPAVKVDPWRTVRDDDKKDKR